MYLYEINHVRPEGVDALTELINIPPAALRRASRLEVIVPVVLGFAYVPKQTVRLRLGMGNALSITDDHYYQKHGARAGTITICGRVNEVNPLTDIDPVRDFEGYDYPNDMDKRRKKLARWLGRGAFMRSQLSVEHDGSLLPPVAMLAVVQTTGERQAFNYSSGRQIFEQYDDILLEEAESAAQPGAVGRY